MAQKELIIARLRELKARLPPAERELPIVVMLGQALTIDQLINHVARETNIGKEYMRMELEKMRRLGLICWLRSITFSSGDLILS